MKNLFIILLMLLLVSCIDTSVKETEIANLKHSTIEKAKIQGDSISIVTQDQYDYVFIKKEGRVVLYKKYVSDRIMIDLPGPLLFLIVVCAIMIGVILRSAFK